MHVFLAPPGRTLFEHPARACSQVRRQRCGLRVLLPLLLVLGIATAGCGRIDEPAAGAADPAHAAGPEVAARVDAARARLSASEGGRRVGRAIDAHGGLEAWYSAPTSSYTWEYANVGADLHFASFLVADNRTRRVYHDLLTVGPYGRPQPVEARFAWDGSEAWIAPDSIEKVNPRFWATSGYYFEQIPFVLADPGIRYEALPDDTLDGVPHTMVRVTFEPGVGDSPGDSYTLYLDEETGRVAAIRYTVTFGREPDAGAPPRETLFYYDDYVTVDGLTVPTRFRGYSFSEDGRGAFKNEAWADSISFRRPFDASRLEAPPNARAVSVPGR